MRPLLVLLAIVLLVLGLALGFIVHGLVLRSLANDVLDDITTSAVPALSAGAHPAISGAHPALSAGAHPAVSGAPSFAVIS